MSAAKKGKRRKNRHRRPVDSTKFWTGCHQRNADGIALAEEDSRRLEESGRPIREAGAMGE